MKHTKEPWIIADDDVFVEVMAGEKTVLPAIRKTEAAEDFRRIVACVNALEGFDIEELERKPPRVIEALEATAKIIDQRDELLDALKLAAEALRNVGAHVPAAAARAVIEKVGDDNGERMKA